MDDEESESVTLTCILHSTDGDPTVGTKKFDDNKWEKVQVCAAIRKTKRNFETSKYYNIINSIPKEVNFNIHGYHSLCYSHFTSIPNEAGSKTSNENDKSEPYLRSKSSETPTSSNTRLGIFEKVCIFCGKNRINKGRKMERLSELLTMPAAEKLLNDSIVLCDDAMLAKISGVDLIAKEMCYHVSCRKMYSKKAEIERLKNVPVDTDDTDANVDANSAIADIFSYVENNIIMEKQFELLTSLYERYILWCEEKSEEPLSSAQYLQKKMEAHFQDRIIFHSSNSKKLGVIVYNANLTYDSAKVVHDFVKSEEYILQRAALILRKSLKETKQDTLLPETMTSQSVHETQVKIPQLVVTFYRMLYGGLSTKTCSDSIERRIQSSSADSLFIFSQGKIKPLKHISLAMTIKSMTGSKKIIAVLNRLGHCVNYSEIEEIETAMALSKLDSNPYPQVSSLPMGLAFDNFDENCGTLSGANTLHDTNGILYQNAGSKTSTGPIHKSTKRKSNTPSSASSNPKKQRTLTHTALDIAPYYKKPRMDKFSYENRDVWDSLDNSSAISGREKDTLWLMSHTLRSRDVPMWVGYNVLNETDILPSQVISYMPNIDKPITRLDVIHKTLEITQKCAEESGQKFGLVTYDLAAAKPATQIQTTESPKFDNIFVMYGAFHIEISYFKALGKLIEQSGGPEILVESDVLSSGSVNGFLKGNYFNRCKRLHPLLSLAFEMLHFKSFLKTYPKSDDLKSNFELIDDSEIFSSEIFHDASVAYRNFQDETKQGKMGRTAQFWYTYVEYINHYHLFERSIRTNNIKLFTWCLTKIIDLFFATNHHNYSRWLTKYQLDLIHIDPQLNEILEAGGFTIQRCQTPFSRCPIDLALEQSVNRDSASKLSGITCMTNNFFARHRYMLTKSNRAVLNTVLFDIVGLNESSTPNAELKPSRIKRDNEDLQKICSYIENSCNPFEAAMHELVNIHTGKSLTPEISESLLTVSEKGKLLHHKFIEECQSDPERFEKPISKVKLLTFTNDCVKTKTCDSKIIPLKCTTDIFGRIIVLSLNANISMELILSYPLTSVPLSMANPDGTMIKTSKHVFLKLIEDYGEKNQCQSIKPDTIIYDGNFLLHTLSNLPKTYGDVARTILCILTKEIGNGKSIHLLFDRYEPSIKDCERTRRTQNNEKQFFITGPLQNRPHDFTSALNSKDFKTNFPSFLIEEWANDNYCQILQQRRLYVSHKESCYSFNVDCDEKMSVSLIDDLSSNHIEADTKVPLHSSYEHENYGARNIVIRASDTDIAVIMLYHAQNFPSCHIWMLAGLQAKNNLRYIDLTEISRRLGTSVCNALPLYYSLTGSDYTSAFFRKGKIKPFQILLRSEEFQNAFTEAMSSEIIEDEVSLKIEYFFCKVYGQKEYCDINTLRYKIFLKTYKQPENGNPFGKLKSLCPKSLPPCRNEFKLHLNRSRFVAKMMVNSTNKDINVKPKEDDGWYFDNGEYKIIWHTGQQYPKDIDSMIPSINDESSSDDENIDIYSSDDDSL